MPDLDYHKHEDDYFRRQDEEQRRKLREQLEAKANEVARREKLAAALKTSDEAILHRGVELGLTGESAKVLHLLPLVHVAWADGSVTAKERLLILQAAEAHGSKPGDEAMTLLTTVLEKRPAQAWLDGVHDLLHAVTRSGGSHAKNIVELCTDVARASGGFLGFGGKVDDAERKFIEQFATSLSGASDRETRSLTQ